jgi:AcrR family transcriptional regulator
MSVLDQKMAARRQQILEAARGLIEARGYDALTMRTLAVKSGVTVPTIYNLIGNKEQVLFEAVQDQTIAFMSNLERVGTDLISLVEATVRHLIRRPRYYRALLLVLAQSERTDSARRHVGRAIAEPIENAINDLAESGTLAKWVNRKMLAQRLHAQLDMASLEWAKGSLTAISFRAAALVDLSTTMLGLTSGRERNSFERIIRDLQAEAIRRPRRSDQRGQAA